MPPRGVQKGSKRDRQYEHIKASVQERGAPESRAEEIAARTVNRERARAGETATASASSTRGSSSSARGGRHSHDEPTKQALYEQARRIGVDGRSMMSKAQLRRALGRTRG